MRKVLLALLLLCVVPLAVMAQAEPEEKREPSEPTFSRDAKQIV